MADALAIMARSPSGDVATIKTRLAAVVPDADDRMALYRAFLRDEIAMARSLREVALRVAYTPPGSQAGFTDLEVRPDELLPQRGGDLGARERNLFLDLFAAGFERVVLIGSDLPTLPAAHVLHALGALEDPARRRVVLGPARDGGYYLLGLNADPPPELFADIRWSTPYALEDTVRAAEACGLAVSMVPEWYDIDDREGFQRLRRDLEAPERAGWAPETAAVLSRIGDGDEA